jgi:hypothetical protein
MKYAVKFTHKATNAWTYCIENSAVKTFSTKAEAETFIEETVKLVRCLGLDHVYKVVEH